MGAGLRRWEWGMGFLNCTMGILGRALHQASVHPSDKSRSGPLNLASALRVPLPRPVLSLGGRAVAS